MMNKLSRILSLPLFYAAAASMLLCSCTSAKKQHPLGYIKKVNNSHLVPGVRLETADKMLQFEYKRRLYGAVESDDIMARFGHYFTVFWQGVDKNANVVVRLEYRQGSSGATLKTQEITPAKIGWRNTTEFSVIGDEYEDNGIVTSWRVLLEVNGEVVDEFQSYLWK